MGQEYVEAHGPSFETVWGVKQQPSPFRLPPKGEATQTHAQLIQPFLLLFVSPVYKYLQPINFL